MTTIDSEECLVLEKIAFADMNAAISKMAAIYQDRTPVLRRESARQWCFDMKLSRALRPQRDALLEENLRRHFDVDLIQSCALQFSERIGPNNKIFYGLTLDHCYALGQWSRWCAERSPDSDQPILLLHFDAHDDLGSPSIVPMAEPGQFGSLIDSSIMTISDVRSVNRFIHRGFIGIGSFIIPLLHTQPSTQFLHIIPQGNEAPWVRRQKEMVLEIEQRFYGDRVAKSLVARSPAHGEEGNRRSVQTNDLSFLRTIDHQGSVFLDIDLDYFCNTYDSNQPVEIEPSPNVIKRRMDEVIVALRDSSILKNLEVVTLALSPDFFPSSLWSLAFDFASNLKKMVCAQQ